MHAIQSRIKPPRSRLAAGLALLALSLATDGLAHAQDFAPQIGFVYPAGGQQGKTIEVTFGGRFLVKPSGVVVSGSGVRAVVVPSEPLLSGKQAADARGKLKELRKQRSPATREEVRKISERLAAHERAKITPAIGERVTVRISIAKNATPGNREVRLITATGLTNALVFQVGQIPECREPEPEQEENWMRIQKSINDPDSRVKAGRNDAPPMAVTLPTTINGQLRAGEIDRFRFRARRGQRLVVDVSGRELLPYLADTVPGWLCATITVLDTEGRDLKPAGDVQIRHDPLHRYEIPGDGEYVLEIKDNLFRGRDDFVYRIRIGEMKPPSMSNIPRHDESALENEKEPNNTPGEAQAVTLPDGIRGRIDEPGDIDVFRFEGKAGERVVAEVLARRLDSPLDSLLIVSDAAGNRIGFNDDHEDKGSGLNTHHADSYLAATLPEDGVYFVHIGDTQQNGGEAYGYLLRISPPQPDFALRVVPSTVNIRANATQPVTVYALRRDGFDGEIALALKNSSAGFVLSGGVIPAGQDKVHCTLTAPDSPGRVPVRLMVEGRAMIGGRAVVRAAVPAQELTQAFFYQHLVPSDDMLAQVAGDFAPASPARILSPVPLKIPANGTAKMLFSVPRYSPRDADRIQLLDAPEGITLKETSRGRDRVELLIEVDGSKVKPGLAGNLVAMFVAKDTTPPGAPKMNPRRVPLGALPAVPFEIVEPRGRKKRSVRKPQIPYKSQNLKYRNFNADLLWSVIARAAKSAGATQSRPLRYGYSEYEIFSKFGILRARLCRAVMSAIILASALLATALADTATHPTPLDTPAPSASAHPANAHGEIDRLIFGRLQQLGIQPANLCSDEVFVRRVYLDVIGTLPTAQETRQFLSDANPDKRAILIDRLLQREEFADYWAMKWGNLLRVKSEFPINLWPNAAQSYHRWIRNAIKENMPCDRFARELLTASGSNFRRPQVNFYRAIQNRTPDGIARAVALTFMGARAENWPADKQADIAAFFSRVGYKATAEWKEEIVFFNLAGTAKAGATAASAAGPVTARFPDGTPVILTAMQDPRTVFAGWLINPENPWFARNIANRAWYWLLGRGIVHEPDDIRPDNPPGNPELLDHLARELAAGGFDLKKLFRLVLNSRTYQLSSKPTPTLADGDPLDGQAEANFAFYPLRRLEAEVLIDAINQITGSVEKYISHIPEPFTYMPEDHRAIALPDASISSAFLELFGRSPRDTGLESEQRSPPPTAAQQLHLLNSSHIRGKLEQSARLRAVIGRGRISADALNELYLAVLSRLPASEERAAMQAYQQSAQKREGAGLDIAWALINSAEFQFRH